MSTETLDQLASVAKAGGLTAAQDERGFSRVAVIGAGTMGTGIAQAVTQTGLDVIICEKDADSLKEGIARLTESLDQEIGRWGMTAGEHRAILARIHAGDPNQPQSRGTGQHRRNRRSGAPRCPRRRKIFRAGGHHRRGDGADR